MPWETLLLSVVLYVVLPLTAGAWTRARLVSQGGEAAVAEINRALVAQARSAAGRDVQPIAGVSDSQSVKSFENTSISGFYAGKRIKGRKRHIITDT